MAITGKWHGCHFKNQQNASIKISSNQLNKSVQSTNKLLSFINNLFWKNLLKDSKSGIIQIFRINKNIFLFKTSRPYKWLLGKNFFCLNFLFLVLNKKNLWSLKGHLFLTTFYCLYIFFSAFLRNCFLCWDQTCSKDLIYTTSLCGLRY